MPVNTPHPSYNEFLAQWTRCRDCYAGSDAVKARGEAYLPRLEGMSPVESLVVLNSTASYQTPITAYDAYKLRAMFYPATGRTVLGLIGLLFSKPPTPPKVTNEDIEKQFNDVTLQGQSLHGFSIELAREVLITGRTGVLVDYPVTPINDEDKRPYWVLYGAEDIINWRFSRIGGKIRLTLLVLREVSYEASIEDEFEPKKVERYRVCRLTGNTESTLQYSVQLYAKNEADDSNNKNEFVPYGPERIPQRRGENLKFIPFQFFGPTTLMPTPEHPPLVDLVDVNLSHYRTSADREHGAHFTALPTPWIKGHTIQEGTSLGMGSGTAWVFPNENAQAGMLEFTGAGLEALATNMEEKRLLMATLGARMLETQKNTQEAAETVAMRHAGEGSALGIMADQIGKGLTNVVAWHLWWNNIEFDSIGDDQIVTLNPEMLEHLTTEDIAKLVAAWQAGAISYKTLYYNLQWGEWTRPDVDAETELEDIEDEAPDEPDPELVAQAAAAAAAAGKQQPPGAGGQLPPDNDQE